MSVISVCVKCLPSLFIGKHEVLVLKVCTKDDILICMCFVKWWDSILQSPQVIYGQSEVSCYTWDKELAYYDRIFGLDAVIYHLVFRKSLVEEIAIALQPHLWMCSDWYSTFWSIIHKDETVIVLRTEAVHPCKKRIASYYVFCLHTIVSNQPHSISSVPHLSSSPP